jgi:DNA (cytosine-5)-methyltransferase 1
VSDPVIIDFFCCGGGASVGFERAGFDVLGIDNEPQPHYPFEFMQMSALDALDILNSGGKIEFDTGRVIDADDVAAYVGSPPCKVHTSLKFFSGAHHLDLIPDTRQRFRASGKPYIIENVPGAPLIDPVQLCGLVFGLGAECIDGWRNLKRHRLFESNIPLIGTPPCDTDHGPVIGVYGVGGGGHQQHSYKGYAQESRDAMGIDWLPQKYLSQALPPAYTKFLGDQLMRALR